MSSKWKSIESIVSAEQLRRFADISKIKEEEQETQYANKMNFLFEEKKYQFSHAEFSEQEFQSLARKAMDAAKNGKYEVEVMRFPALYCTDGGRAINNTEKNWPETLVGKARSFYKFWEKHGHPNGYRLKARINDYPGGFIGDISIFIDWS
ncbi:MAG: histidine kinase [Proteobacteria bacterium]|nr:histidine kinase [Pseudomonadota bacterium]MDA1022102.1 histidine kinase [Pseudomonadota bacterium]